MTDVGVTAASLSERVADELRVALARKRMSAAALARELGVSQTYIWRRLEGQTAFDLDDLEKVAQVLGINVMDLLPSTVRTGERSPVNVRSSRVGRTGYPDRVPPAAASPFTRQRRDRTHPTSAVPASQRRPHSLRPRNAYPIPA